MDGRYVGRDRRRHSGKLLSQRDIDLVALAYLHGIDGWRILTTGDPVELVVLSAIVQRAQELADMRDENLARRIISTLGEALKRG